MANCACMGIMQINKYGENEVDAAKTEQLINCLNDYKTEMAYKGLDFDADKPRLYKDIRFQMAKWYSEIDEEMFGPVELTTATTQHISDEKLKNIKVIIKWQREVINRGRNRIQEKIKDIRQNYSKAVINGTRSGSGEIVYEHFESWHQYGVILPAQSHFPLALLLMMMKLLVMKSIMYQKNKKLFVIPIRPLGQLKKVKMIQAILVNQLSLL